MSRPTSRRKEADAEGNLESWRRSTSTIITLPKPTHLHLCDMSTPPSPNRSFTTNGMPNLHAGQSALQNGNSIVYFYNSSDKPYRPMSTP